MPRTAEVYRGYGYHPHDVLVACKAVLGKRFDLNTIRGIRPKWYALREPVVYASVKVNLTEDVQVPQGAFEIPGLGRVVSNDGAVIIRIDQHRRHEAEQLLSDIQKHLDTQSIYRGRAVTSSLGFMDLAGISADRLVYSEKVRRDLEAHVWALIERGPECERADVQLPRKVLFAGPFGSGKTLATLLTAQKAVNHGWTVMCVEPTSKPSSISVFTLDFAHKYQKAVVVIEDFDREQRERNPYALGQLMSAIDGALSKTRELLIIMTTNFPDKIGAGLQRPGRIDKVINFGHFTRSDAIELLRKTIPGTFLDPEIDWDAVSEACDSYTPAFVQEVATSAKLMAISKQTGDMPRVTQDMLVEAARDLHDQHRICQEGLLGFHAK